MIGGGGQPTTLLYTTCPLVVEDDHDRYGKFDEIDKDTVDVGGGVDGWGGHDGIMDSLVETPWYSSTPKTNKTKKANAKTRQKRKKGQKTVKWTK